MEQPAPTRPKSKKSSATLPSLPSSAPSHTAPSPELLLLIDSLKAEIADLRKVESLTSEEKKDLAQLKVDLKAAQDELAEMKRSQTQPSSPAGNTRRLNFGLFQVEEC